VFTDSEDEEHEAVEEDDEPNVEDYSFSSDSTPETSKRPVMTPKIAPTPSTRQLNAQKKQFAAIREQLAIDYTAQLDDIVCNKKISHLTADTGGIRVEWNTTLRSTAGTAQGWRSGPNDGAIHALEQDDFDLFKSIRLENKYRTRYQARICLSTKVLDTEDRVRETVAHEFCHLLVAIFHHKGVNPKGFRSHGTEFKQW